MFGGKKKRLDAHIELLRRAGAAAKEELSRPSDLSTRRAALDALADVRRESSSFRDLSDIEALFGPLEEAKVIYDQLNDDVRRLKAEARRKKYEGLRPCPGCGGRKFFVTKTAVDVRLQWQAIELHLVVCGDYGDVRIRHKSPKKLKKIDDFEVVVLGPSE
ncbi:MAG: hypothetical protein JKY37_34945 [Nannocystaceae bacterium]|nr:hypothetical protein [Nannocystaceae bacterium]